MCELHLPETLVALAEAGRIGPEKVEWLQSEIFPQGLRSFIEAEQLLAIDGSAHAVCPQWKLFVKSSICDLIKKSDESPQFIENWVTMCVARKGVVDSEDRFQLLMGLISAVENLPVSLSVLALKQVQLAISSGTGPLANAAGYKELTLLHVKLICEIMFATSNSASDEQLSLLFEIDHQTRFVSRPQQWADYLEDILNKKRSTLAGQKASLEKAQTTYRLSSQDEKTRNLKLQKRNNLSLSALPTDSCEHKSVTTGA